MASGPITSWQVDVEKNETVTDFIYSKITVDSECSHEIKRRLFLGKKSYDKPRQQVQKHRFFSAQPSLSASSHIHT